MEGCDGCCFFLVMDVAPFSLDSAIEWRGLGFVRGGELGVGYLLKPGLYLNRARCRTVVVCACPPVEVEALRTFRIEQGRPF